MMFVEPVSVKYCTHEGVNILTCTLKTNSVVKRNKLKHLHN